MENPSFSIFSLAAQAADVRYRESIDRASHGKKSDIGVRLRGNVQVCDRLVRKALDLKPAQPITRMLAALTVACPEPLLAECLDQAWSGDRRDPPHPLVAAYLRDQEPDEFRFDQSSAIEHSVAPYGLIQEVLLCHGLSPTPDSILLLADIGRAARISYALGLSEVHVMLADVTWMKHNRSIRDRFAEEDEYRDSLVVCQDKRERLYKALKLKVDIFEISDNEGPTAISLSRLREAARMHREIAVALWGEEVLEPHDPGIKALVGQSFESLMPHRLEALPAAIRPLLRTPRFGAAIEDSLRPYLIILRAVSELFSSFDEDVFIYYLAQFYAQDAYKQFLKVAVYSELKFDRYYDEHHDIFAGFASGDMQSQTTVRRRRVGRTVPVRRYAYFPQYRLSDLKVLPYTSLSLDVKKSDEPLETLLDKMILLRDCGEKTAGENLAKIERVLRSTSLLARNRLISDLLSFTHLLVSRVRSEAQRGTPLEQSIQRLGKRIAEELYSPATSMNHYMKNFQEWLTAIDDPHSVHPFHLKPYNWDEARWSDEMFRNAATFIFELLMAVRRLGP